MKINGTGSNTKDPISKLAPSNAQHLLREFGRAADAFGMRDVLDASGSMIISALRQRFETRKEAEVAFDEIFAKMKSALFEHYDGISGRKKGVFPYDQHLYADLVDARSKIITN